MAPQDVTYRGEPTRLEIGDHNEIRECVTINRGTVKGGGLTKVGSHLLIMAYTHIGHDCVIQDHAMLVNGATLAACNWEWAVVGRCVRCISSCASVRIRILAGDDHYAGCAALFDDVSRARYACLRDE